MFAEPHQLPSEPRIVIRRSLLDYCSGDHCAAALLDFLLARHAAESAAALQRRAAGELLPLHHWWLAYNSDELAAHLLNLWGRARITKARRRLCELGVLVEHPSPLDYPTNSIFFEVRPHRVPKTPAADLQEAEQ